MFSCCTHLWPLQGVALQHSYDQDNISLVAQGIRHLGLDARVLSVNLLAHIIYALGAVLSAQGLLQNT